MALEREMETFTKNAAEMQGHEGKFVLIHGDTIVDFFTSYEDAIKAGYQRFALEPFLVKQVQAVTHAQFISRLFDPLTASHV